MYDIMRLKGGEVMKIVFHDIKQSEFACAIECLNLCKQENAPENGFEHPYFMPGGVYGKQWLQLDSSLALSGNKKLYADTFSQKL